MDAHTFAQEHTYTNVVICPVLVQVRRISFDYYQSRADKCIQREGGSSTCKSFWRQVGPHTCFSHSPSEGIQTPPAPKRCEVCHLCWKLSSTHFKLTVCFWLEEEEDSWTFTNSHQFYWKLLKTFKNSSSEGTRWCHNEFMKHFLLTTLLPVRLRTEF